MPKQRITKEMVVEAAFEIARKEGAEKVIVKILRKGWAVPSSPFTATAPIWRGFGRNWWNVPGLL